MVTAAGWALAWGASLGLVFHFISLDVWDVFERCVRARGSLLSI